MAPTARPLLPALLLFVAPAAGACYYYTSVGCAADWEATLYLSFYDDGDGGSDEYEASVSFHWEGYPPTEVGVRSYPAGEESAEEASKRYWKEGNHRVAATVTFGEGASCRGRTLGAEGQFLLAFEGTRCSVRNATGFNVNEAPLAEAATEIPAIEPTPSPSTRRPPGQGSQGQGPQGQGQGQWQSLLPISAQPSARPTVSPSTPAPSKAPTRSPRKPDTRLPIALITADPTPRPVEGTDAPVENTAPDAAGDADVAPDPPTGPTAPASDGAASPADEPTAPTPTALTESTMDAVPSVMALYYAEEMDDGTIEAWEVVTETTIKDEAVAMTKLSPTLFNVVVNLTKQEKALTRSRRQTAKDSSRHGRSRNLQPTSELLITFTTTVTISLDESKVNWNTTRVLESAFQTADKQGVYIASLKEEDPHFANVERMTMEVGGVLITDAENKKGGTEEASSPATAVGLLVGGALGGAAILLCGMALGVFYMKRRRGAAGKKEGRGDVEAEVGRDKLNLPDGRETETRTSTQTGGPRRPEDLQYIQPNQGEVDDISTLGDPYFGDTGNAAIQDADNTMGESMVSSQQELYVYGVKKPQSATDASRVGASTISGGKGFLFGDDTYLEDSYQQALSGGVVEGDSSNLQHITAVAPPGMLGIVLDNPRGDMPVVHAIRESSVLSGRVRVGDFLLSVDGVDCRGMSAHELSKFLNSRSQNPERTLVLGRAATGRAMA